MKKILLIQALMNFTYGLLIPILSIYINNITSSISITSIAFSFSSLGSLIIDLISIFKPSLIIGKKKALFASLYFVIRTLLYASTKNVALLSLYFFLFGIFINVINMNLLYLFRNTTKDKVKGFSWLNFFSTVSYIVSSYLSGIIATFSMKLVLYSCLFFSFPTVFLISKLDFKKVKIKEEKDIVKNFVKFKDLWLIYMILSFISPLIYTYPQIFMEKEGYSYSFIGVIYSLSYITSSVAPLILKNKKVLSFSPLLLSISLLPLLHSNYELSIVLYSTLSAFFYIYRASKVSLEQYNLSSTILESFLYDTTSFISFFLLPLMIEKIGIKIISIIFSLIILTIAIILKKK